MTAAYYNENDPYAAQWLRNLMAENHICAGFVDERSIADVQPGDLTFFTQCHFFAGVGVWSHALRCAGWPDDRPIWTGSCPCQPFSGAGKRGGFADERHLWPVWFDLIAECRPDVILGEQVASPDGLGWWDSVQDDLESADYASAALDLCVPGVSGPHIRQRLYWVADANNARSQGRCERGNGTDQRAAGSRCVAGGLDNAASARCERALEITEGEARHETRLCMSGEASGSDESFATGPVNGFWRAADWLFCRDGKWRPVRSGTFPLAHGTPNRVAKLRAAGNAIVAPQATQFIETVMEYI